MQNAFIAGTLIAIICGIVSFFVVLRKAAFAAHGLGHISLTGASGAVLIGVSAMNGQLIANMIAAIFMGFMGDKIKKNDLAIGIVLTFFLGLGAYFLYLYQTGYSGSIMSILFGNILTVSYRQIIILLIMAIIIICALSIVARSLFFCSIDPIIAQSKNIPSRLLSMIFFIILALTVTMACQIVGALLVFTLLIGPAASAFQWSDGFYKSMLLSIMISLISVWGALCLAFYVNLPASFCITMIICLIYIIGLIKNLMWQ
ncbi:metal ABC transporter permease [Fastidiosibacter lacustris]|uniref:metal ABC transporter permease n=1 Tax=Fastidiosibacter lacustris TaxID=2056695 RepID=UPI000E344775